jgi:four helix bundle protein
MQFLSIAKGSADEVKAQLYVALDQDYLSQEKFEKLQTLVESRELLLGGFMRYLKRSDAKGPKFRRDS